MEADEALLAAWRAGEARAGRALFTRHVDGITRFFLSKLSTGVEDLVQRTFLALLEKTELPPGVGLRPYLFGIARKLLLRRLRDEYRAPFDPLTRSAADLQSTPSAILDRRAQVQALYRALQTLPIDLQIAVELFYWESLTAPEIGAVLDLPEGTVRSRLRRGRELLAEALGRSGDALVEADFERWARALRDRIGR